MVEWKKLGDVCSLKARIGWQGLTQKEHKTTGEYLLVTGTDFTSNYEVDFDHCVYVDEERYTQDPNIQLRQNDVLITKDGTLGKMAVIENLPKPATLNGGLFVIRDLTGKIHHKYLLHYMLSSKFQSIIESNHTNGTIKHLTQALLTNFPIPIPTLEKQLEIVRILDTFTASIDNLKEQIAQRRKQFEYYRDHIIKNNFSTYPNAILKDVAIIKNGKDYKDLNSGSFPVYGSGGIMTYVNKYASDKPSVLLPRKGSIDNIFYVDKPFWTVDTIYWTDINTSKVLPKYLFDSLSIYNLKEYAYGGARPSLSQPILYKLALPIPPLSEQQRIVDILDKFEASIQNLEAQLSQREKQYEYYRNKLLTFD